MIILFRNVPAQTKDHHLAEFIEPALKAAWFRKRIVIEELKVIHLHDQHSKTSEFHGLVTIQLEAAGRRVITRLNKKRLLGKPIIVREYHRRLWHNDPRVKHNPQNLEIPCRRNADRRRKKLEMVKDVSTKFSGDKSFHRQHN